jgi:hypothetical protein
MLVLQQFFGIAVTVALHATTEPVRVTKESYPIWMADNILLTKK